MSSFYQKFIKTLLDLIETIFKKETNKDNTDENSSNSENISDEKDNIENGDDSDMPKNDKTYDIYIVSPGDSWWNIASKYLNDGNKCYELASYNGKTINDAIHPGDAIRIPKFNENNNKDEPSNTKIIRRDLTEAELWNYFKSCGFNDFGVAGLMGNLYAESGLKSNNLQNSYEIKLNIDDEDYVTSVDDGSYYNFIHDSAGFGIAQWTFWSRKQALLEYAHSLNTSIADTPMQCDFLVNELRKNYKNVYNHLMTASSVKEASDMVLLDFERPADQSENHKELRASYGMSFYDKYTERS